MNYIDEMVVLNELRVCVLDFPSDILAGGYYYFVLIGQTTNVGNSNVIPLCTDPKSYI